MIQKHRAVIVGATILVLGIAGYLFWERARMEKLATAARGAFRERNLEQADRDVAQWLKVVPQSGEAWYWKARIELARDRPAESVAALTKARDLGYSPQDVEAVSVVMQVFGGKFDVDDSILTAALSNSNDPEPEFAQALARVYLASFRFGPAMKALERWMKDAPEDPKPYLWRNEIDERTSGDATPVIRNYREALKRDPTLQEARLGLAERLRVARRADEAAKEYAIYLKSNPQSLAANRGAGQVALETGDTAAAIEDFNAVLAVNPKEPVALRELALLDLRSGRFEKAAERLKTATEAEPYDPDLHFNLAKALKLAGKIKESEAESIETERLRKDQEEMNGIREALVGRPDDPKLRLKAARWLLEHGHDKEGLEWTDLILKSNPGDKDTCVYLAEYHRKKGQMGLANYYKLEATTAAPSSPPR